MSRWYPDSGCALDRQRIGLGVAVKAMPPGHPSSYARDVNRSPDVLFMLDERVNELRSSAPNTAGAVDDDCR